MRKALQTVKSTFTRNNPPDPGTSSSRRRERTLSNSALTGQSRPLSGAGRPPPRGASVPVLSSGAAGPSGTSASAVARAATSDVEKDLPALPIEDAGVETPAQAYQRGRLAVAQRNDAINDCYERALPGYLRREAPAPAAAALPPHHVHLKPVSTFVVAYPLDPPPDGKRTTSHGFVAMGNPGDKGKVLEVSGDHTRSGVTVDGDFQQRVLTKTARDGTTPLFSADVRQAIAAMADQDFRCKEDFYRAYFAERQRMNPTPADATAFTRQLAQETKNLFIHCIPETAMEHWPRTPNGPDAAKPNIIERDTRAFVNLTGVDMFTGQPLDERHRAPGEPPPAANRLTQEQIHSGNVLELGHVALRRVHNVDSIKLLEADSQWRMYQRFVDEMFKRDGSMAPLAADAFPDRNPPWTEAQLNTAKAAIPTYQMYPDRAFDHGWAPGTGNCNSGVAQLLRQAGAAERDIKAASPWSFGIDAPDMNIWDPLRGAPDDRPVPGPHIEATSSRGRVLDMTAVADAVQRKYEQYEADLAAAGAA